jgi:hypothetical protein
MMTAPGFTFRHRPADGGEIVVTVVLDEGGSGGNAPVPVDLDRLRSIGFGSRTRNTVREGRRPDGVRWKATTDELRTTVTEHAKGDRQDVHLRPAPVTGQISMKESAPWLANLTARTSKRS